MHARCPLVGPRTQAASSSKRNLTQGCRSLSSSNKVRNFTQ